MWVNLLWIHIKVTKLYYRFFFERKRDKTICVDVLSWDWRRRNMSMLLNYWKASKVIVWECLDVLEVDLNCNCTLKLLKDKQKWLNDKIVFAIWINIPWVILFRKANISLIGMKYMQLWSCTLESYYFMWWRDFLHEDRMWFCGIMTWWI